MEYWGTGCSLHWRIHAECRNHHYIRDQFNWYGDFYNQRGCDFGFGYYNEDCTHCFG